MNTITKLERMLKRASKLNDSQAKETALLLYELYMETHDEAKISDYLMRFKPTVYLFFFEKAVQSLEQEKIELLYAAICGTESYIRNANHAATTRGFILAAVLIKNNANIAQFVLMRTLFNAEKNGKFSDTVINFFKQYVVDYCGGIEPIMVLEDKTWDKTDNGNRFIRFINAVRSRNVTLLSVAKSCEKTENSALPITSTQSKEIGMPFASHNEDASKITQELIIMLSSALKEAATLVQSLSDSNGTISLLRKEISNRDLRITELSSTLSERNRDISGLQNKIIKSEQTLLENETHISDLSEKLKTSRQMDAISQNQELAILKTNLANSLKLEYDDYIASKDIECNPDDYEARLNSLTRIFKILRRFEILK